MSVFNNSSSISHNQSARDLMRAAEVLFCSNVRGLKAERLKESTITEIHHLGLDLPYDNKYGSHILTPSQ